MSSYRCPKCGNAMQSYNRSGLTVEQCGGCRGVFLDYGELERLVQAEGQWYEQQYAQPGPPAGPPPGPMPGPAPGPAPGYPPQQSGYGYANPSKPMRPGYANPSKPFHPGHGYGHRKKRKGFLSELFDD